VIVSLKKLNFLFFLSLCTHLDVLIISRVFSSSEYVLELSLEGHEGFVNAVASFGVIQPIIDSNCVFLNFFSALIFYFKNFTLFSITTKISLIRQINNKCLIVHSGFQNWLLGERIARQECYCMEVRRIHLSRHARSHRRCMWHPHFSGRKDFHYILMGQVSFKLFFVYIHILCTLFHKKSLFVTHII
jgi:hypothetical protein